MTVFTYNGTLTPQEIELVKQKAAAVKGCDHVSVTVEGDFLDIEYHIMPFERIRRITGYLVGDMGRWNDAKRYEERDRVKHDVL